jgi:hypothetical protein
MELLDRYLDAVKLWLPRAQADDIAAELAADIRAEIEAKEESSARPATRDEVEAILTRWGHPMLVASRYQRQESFIGAPFYPMYRFALKLLFFVYCLPWFAVWLALTTLQPSWLASASGVASLGPLITNALWLFALVTAAFALVERAYRRNRTLETWRARQLLDAESGRDWRDISRLSSAIELAVGAAVLSWWSGLAASPSIYDIDGIARVRWTPLEQGFYRAILTLMVADVVMSAANLWHARWTFRRLVLQIGLDAIGVLVVLLMLPRSLVEVMPAGSQVQNAALLAYWANLSWQITLGVVAAILAARVIVGIRRLGRVEAAQPAPVQL